MVSVQKKVEQLINPVLNQVMPMPRRRHLDNLLVLNPVAVLVELVG